MATIYEQTRYKAMGNGVKFQHKGEENKKLTELQNMLDEVGKNMNKGK